MAAITPVAIAAPIESSIGYNPLLTPTAFGFHVHHALPAGTFVSVLVADAFGFGNQLMGVTDSKGNRYTVDSHVNEPGGGGNAYMASGVLAAGLTTSDRLTIQSDLPGWSSFYLVVVGFTDSVVSLDAAGAPHGATFAQPLGGSLSVSVTPAAAGELVVAMATYQAAPIDDDPAWTEIIAASDADDDNVVVAYRLSADTSPLSYDTSCPAPAFPGPAYCASAICAYGTAALPPPPPGVTSVSANAISQGIRERVPCVARTSTQQHE